MLRLGFTQYSGVVPPDTLARPIRLRSLAMLFRLTRKSSVRPRGMGVL